MALVKDMDLRLFTIKLVHTCCEFQDENYFENAMNEDPKFKKTLDAAKKFDRLKKTLLNKVAKSKYKQYFDALKNAVAVRELDNDSKSILFVENEKRDTLHLITEKCDTAILKAYFELLFFDKCVAQRYLSCMKQTPESFNQFAWSEWTRYSEHFSLLINVACKKEISS